MVFAVTDLNPARTDVANPASTQSVEHCRSSRDDSIFLKKTPKLKDADAVAYRIMNEWVATEIARLCITKMRTEFKQAQTEFPIELPHYEIVFDEDLKLPTALAVRKVEYNGIDELELLPTPKRRRDALEELIGQHIGIAQALRCFVQDPDGCANIGFAPKDQGKTVVLIDFGLADYFQLREHGYLNEDECERLDESTVETRFNMTLQNVVFGMFPVTDDSYNLETTLHLFSDFDSSSNSVTIWDQIDIEYLQQLCHDYYYTLEHIAAAVTCEDVADQLLKSATQTEQGSLAIADLCQSTSDFKTLFTQVVSRYQAMARLLAGSLKEASIKTFTDLIGDQDGLPSRVQNKEHDVLQAMQNEFNNRRCVGKLCKRESPPNAKSAFELIRASSGGFRVNDLRHSTGVTFVKKTSGVASFLTKSN